MPRRALLAAPVLIASALTLLPAPAAHAAGVRYAAPGAAPGANCLTLATACSIETAVNAAAAGDEVVLAPGTYAVSTSLENSTGIWVHGTPGQPRPVITSSAFYGLRLSGDTMTAKARVNDVTIVHTNGGGSGLQIYSSTSIERVDVRSSGQYACQIGLANPLRDSLCVATRNSAFAVYSAANGAPSGSFNIRLRNVTAVATGTGSVGLHVALGGGGTASIDLRNSIVSGDVIDIEKEGNTGSTVNLVSTSSNWGAVASTGLGATPAPGSGTNQNVAPVFADTTSYHQAATSPTVDKGTALPDLGATDLDGDPRALGSAPDIGVDEFVPPVPPPPPVTPADTTAPDTTFTKTAKKRTYKRSATFRFTGSEAGATFTCRLDSKPAAPCSSPWKVKVKPGKHTVTVTARDAAGNLDATPATYRWKVRKRAR